MSRLFIRLWWGIVVYSWFVLPALAQDGLQEAPAGTLYMEVSPDNRWLATSTWSATTLYTLPDRRLVRGLLGDRPVFAGNRLLALNTPEGVVLRDVPSLRLVKRLPTSGWLQASRDGRWLLVYRYAHQLTDGTDGTIVDLWQLMPPQRRLHLVLPFGSEVALSADGRYLFQATPAGGSSTDVTVRSTLDGRMVRQFRVDISGKLAVSPSGDKVAFAHPTRVEVYRVDNAQLLYTFTDVGESLGFSTLCFSPDGNYLAGGYGLYYESGAWRLWRLADGALVAGETYPHTGENEVWTLGFTGDSATLVVAFPYRILLVDTHSGATLDEWRASKRRMMLGFLASEEEFAVADEQNIRFYASANGLLTRQVEWPPPGAPPFVCAISADGNTYAVYPYQDGLGVFHLPPSGTATPLLTVPLFPNSNLDEPMIARLSDDGSSLFVLDVFGKVHRIRVGEGTISTLAEGEFFDVTPDGSLLVTAGGEVKVLRVSDGAVLYTLLPVQWLGVTQNGQSLATVRREQNNYHVSLYDLPTGSLIRETAFYLPPDPRDPVGARVTVSPDAKVIVVTRELWTERETTLYHWESDGHRLITLWRGGSAPSQLTFSRNGRYVAFSPSMITRGFSDKVGVWGRLVLNGWLGVFPEHLRYALRDVLTGEVLDEGTLHITETLDVAAARFILPIPVDRRPDSLSLTVEGRPFLKRTLLVSEVAGGWAPKPVSLLPGDIDGDNEVTLFDFGRLVSAFGSFAGEERYDIDADLDGDGEISLWDFGWLVNHFGMIGDE